MTVKGQPWPSDLDNYDDDDDDDDENTDYEEFDMLQTCWIMISVLRPWSGWKVLPAALETIPVDDIVTIHSVVVDDDCLHLKTDVAMKLLKTEPVKKVRCFPKGHRQKHKGKQLLTKNSGEE